MQQEFELRILSGLHHGARCPVRASATIGSHPQCDVVLSDEAIPPEAATIRIEEDGWRLSLDGVAEDASPVLPFNTSAALGATRLTVASADAPWIEPIEEPLRAPDSGSAGQPGSVLGDGVRVQGEAKTHRRGSKTRPAQDRGRAGMLWSIAGILLVLVFGGVAVAAFSPPRMQPAAKLAPLDGTGAESLGRVLHVLQQLSFAERVSASLSPDHHVVITGWVRDEPEHDRLSTALASIWPSPTLQVGTQEQMTRRIESLVQDLDIRVAVDYLSAGRYTIRGIAGSDTVRNEAFDRWTAGLGNFASAAAQITLASEALASVQAAVANADLDAVSVEWSTGTFVIRAKGYDAIRLGRLQALIDVLNVTYMNALVIEPVDAAPPSSVPFRIHSVVGGAQPWLVLEDGTRMVVGGTHGDYLLKSIDDGRIVFEGPNTAVITR